MSLWLRRIQLFVTEVPNLCAATWNLALLLNGPVTQGSSSPLLLEVWPITNCHLLWEVGHLGQANLRRSDRGLPSGSKN
ncbi:hypothetical protein AVEN_237920-1 [Araneus ventricosus]|uniref:Uncharacterized protein n=1 Tax=Araneus ventricosus TaxID=182803 RepID=A0A4Y2FWK0_ARAVE|nr:hypothetical protein AVEN_237920-1 [Araneus ventricosus]